MFMNMLEFLSEQHEKLLLEFRNYFLSSEKAIKTAEDYMGDRKAEKSRCEYKSGKNTFWLFTLSERGFTL
jgi:hypothetical protein